VIEGLCHSKLPVFSVQYHPEASPGPHDSNYLFKRFTEMMRTKKPVIQPMKKNFPKAWGSHA
jgi:carbamoyl-phosphate synthase small subunit